MHRPEVWEGDVWQKCRGDNKEVQPKMPRCKQKMKSEKKNAENKELKNEKKAAENKEVENEDNL